MSVSWLASTMRCPRKVSQLRGARAESRRDPEGPGPGENQDQEGPGGTRRGPGPGLGGRASGFIQNRRMRNGSGWSHAFTARRSDVR
ncbi:hypothetical protein EYF80_063340 [Liparis tanakae]|uniref:Uncharacterized protein n=1 Tax=Liparis tanakae TaxID=230148 RepID=A0A4Z2ECS4_9TELE|nr:hypothetical protein EYF80_063340 [Liparis tanakae]